ncbi:MAG: 50S ribosomal protein L4 [Halobacteriota archaeon]|nr:50S ribosomal protein L4 [Halobacteriota archaeon]
MMASVIDLSGNVVKEIELPSVFEEFYRPDLIKKAVLAAQANRLQPYGPTSRSGVNTSAMTWGTGRAAARVPRIKNGRRAARVPQAVGGRRAHPPKPEKDYSEKINDKERKKAIRSAIAATADSDMVKSRGHKFERAVPVVVEDGFEGLSKTKEVQSFLQVTNLWEDVLRAKNGKAVRAGKGTMRGRRYKRRKSILIVSKEGGNILRAARNLPGVDVTPVKHLNAELLAPGADAGRLVVWTESAISELGAIYKN